MRTPGAAPWSLEEKRRLAELWRMDVPAHEIASELGRSVQAITTKAYIMKLPLRRGVAKGFVSKAPRPTTESKPNAKYESGVQPCMCCNRPFKSEWLEGHRICTPCKQTHGRGIDI